MIYKSMFLTLLLAPFMIIANNPKNARIQELEEMISQKELELFDLGNMIAEKDALLSSFESDSQELLRLLRDKRVKQLENQNKSNLSQEDKSRVAEEIRKKTNDFFYNFIGALANNEPIDGMLESGLFQKDEFSEHEDFESLRFYLIQHFFNELFIKQLVNKYEKCIKEYRTLFHELIDLQKQEDLS